MEQTDALNVAFFKEVIHPEDLHFWIEVYHAFIEILNNDELKADEVDYFSFSIRVKSAFSLNGNPDYLKIYVKMFPQWTNKEFQYGRQMKSLRGGSYCICIGCLCQGSEWVMNGNGGIDEMIRDMTSTMQLS